MAYATNAASHDSVAQINITPLVDVMLVLLVIFMIAAPIVTQRIVMDLPGTARLDVTIQPPPPITLRMDAAGQLYWNGQATSADALEDLLETERARDEANLPTLQIDASDDADYAAITRVLAEARNADWPRVGFIRR